MEITAGLFALGGVALTALLTELRGWREARVRQTTELASLRRELYIRALHDVEAVASVVGTWSSTMPGSEETEAVSSASFWAALTTAYKSLQEVRLLGCDQAPALAMKDALLIYRNQVESGVRELPKARPQLDAMLAAFRRDLGLE
jgi:hypothetical protein